VSSQVVTRRGDSVPVYGPLPPRERKQLSYTYVLSATARRVSVPIDQATDEVDLLLEDTTAVVTAAKLDSLGPEDIGGRRFARYRTPPLVPGAGLTIAFSDRRLAPESPVPFLVGPAAAAHTAQALAHLRSVGGGRFRYAPLDTADPPRGFCRADHHGLRAGRTRPGQGRHRRHRRRGSTGDARRARPAHRVAPSLVHRDP